MLEVNGMEHLFRWLGEQAPTGKGGPSQQVWECPGALVNICRAAITQLRCRGEVSGGESLPFSTRLGGGCSHRNTPKNRGTPERRQPGITSANNRRSAGAVGRLGWRRPDELSCCGARFVLAPAHAAEGWLKVSADGRGWRRASKGVFLGRRCMCTMICRTRQCFI